MATLDPVTVTTDWTLVYDAAVSGSFTGSVQCFGPSPTYLRVSPSLPVEQAGFMVGTTPLALSLSGSEKLYGRANGIDGASSRVLLG